MEITFTKGKDGRTCSWTALRPPRTRVPGPAMAAGAGVPHDLATFVIEDALGIEHGFWDCVADGATFRSMRRKRTEPGKAVIRRHRAQLDAAECRVNAVYARWSTGESTPVDDALDRALTEWRRLPEGGALVREWRSTRPRHAGRRR